MWSDPESVSVQQALEDKLVEALSFFSRIRKENSLSLDTCFFFLETIDLLTRGLVDEKFSKVIDAESSSANYILRSDDIENCAENNVKAKITTVMRDADGNIAVLDYEPFSKESSIAVFLSSKKDETMFAKPTSQANYNDYLEAIKIFESQGYQRIHFK